MIATPLILLVAQVIGTGDAWAANGAEAKLSAELTATERDDEARYADQLNQLRTELTAKVPQNDQANAGTLNEFLASGALDAKLAKYVVLLEATPQGLTEFAEQGGEKTALVEKLLADAALMKQMLVADGAAKGKF